MHVPRGNKHDIQRHINAEISANGDARAANDSLGESFR